jgi:hypothetical protein
MSSVNLRAQKYWVAVVVFCIGYGSTSVASIKLPANNNVWSIKWSKGLS